MSSATWTKGPWEFAGDGIWASTQWNARVKIVTIAFFSPMNAIDSKANGRLIAAAPDLYASLVEIREMLFARPDMVEVLRPLMGFAENAISDRAAAAIAKAEQSAPATRLQEPGAQHE